MPEGAAARMDIDHPETVPTVRTPPLEQPALAAANLSPDRIDPKTSLGLPTLQSLIDNPRIKICLTKMGLLFSGPTAFLSNMATSPFVLDSVDYVSSEQGHQSIKDVTSGDMQAAFDIMKETRPFKIHKRG